MVFVDRGSSLAAAVFMPTPLLLAHGAYAARYVQLYSWQPRSQLHARLTPKPEDLAPRSRQETRFMPCEAKTLGLTSIARGGLLLLVWSAS